MPVHTQGKRSVLPPAGWVLLLYPDRNPEPQRDVPAGLVVLGLGTRLADPEASGSRPFRRQNRIALDTPDGGSLPWALNYQQPKTLGSSRDPQLQRTAEKLKVSTSSATALKKALGAGTL